MQKTILALLMLICLMSGVVAAQDDADCTPEAFQAMLTSYGERFDDEPADVVARDLAAELAHLGATCAGWAFNGTTGQVIRPFELPAGFYIVRATWDDFGSLELATTTEACERDVRYSRLSTGGHVGGSDEGILELSADCSIMVDVSTHGKWTLEIEAL